MSIDQSVDIAIAGAGPAGLIAAAALASTGQNICVIDPVDPKALVQGQGRDLRSTAFLKPACDLFETIGIWKNLRPVSHRLRALRIVDLTGEPPAVREEKTFSPIELGLDEFGWNILNWELRNCLLGHLNDLNNVHMIFGHRLERLFTRDDIARLSLSDGRRITCKLAIAADGRNSVLRSAAGIPVETTRYGQKSIAFSILHDVPHEDISTELYLHGGPFTMVPLGEMDGKFASAVVWMNEGPYANELLNLPIDDFEAAMEQRTAGLFGTLSLASDRGIFPIISQKATTFSGQRVAVIAEAAHVLPPIGAQGLNTSVGDIASLFERVQNENDPGSPSALEAYSQSRATDVKMRARAIDLFNRVTRSPHPALQTLRLGGLRAAYHIAPLRKNLMRTGLGGS